MYKLQYVNNYIHNIKECKQKVIRTAYRTCVKTIEPYVIIIIVIIINIIIIIIIIAVIIIIIKCTD